MKTSFSSLYGRVVANKQKAIVAFLIAAIGSFLAKHGLTLHASAVSYIQSITVGVIAHVGVYFKANK